jgi:LmbE family N-acetylglucosaminyl deacetylase
MKAVFKVFLPSGIIAVVCLSLTAQAPYKSSIAASDVAIELPANHGAAALWQSLKKLHTRASLIMITAHPDDEDGGMLTYESRGQGARVALLTLNRGEGGANVMSSDYFDALGLVRTEELLAADRYYGVDQYWTRVVDYGFSKTMDETLSKWTRERVLYDVVRVVRMVRPLVITSVFVGGPSDGHGNHQTAGLMAREVYRLAGDPTAFPEQIKAGLKPWTPLKDYARVPFSRRGSMSPLAVNLEVPEGDYDPSLGLNYSQFSREGLGHQKSQNGGSGIPAAGPIMSAYHRFDSRVAAEDKEQSFFDGIDTSLTGIATLAKQGETIFLVDALRRINADVEHAMDQFSAAQPGKIAPLLASGLKGTIALLDRLSRSDLSEDAKYDISCELNIKRAQFNDALAEALGIAVRATVTPATEPDPRVTMFMGEPDTFRIAIPGQTFGVKVQIVNQSSASVSIRRVSLKPVESKWWSISDTKPAAGELPPGQLLTATFRATVAAFAGYTRPYFSRPNIEQAYYDILDERYLSLPRSPYPLSALAEMTYEGVPIVVDQVVQTVKRVTGLGQVLEPLVVGPSISVAVSPRAGIVPLDSKSFPVAAVVHSNVKGPAKGTLRLELPSGWRSTPESAEFSAAQEGEDHPIAFQVAPVNLAEKSYEITAVATYSGKSYREGYQVTGYSGLRPYFLYTSSTYRTTGVDIKVAPGLKVGYIMGSGDDVPACLEHLGIKVSFLTAADVASGDLSTYDVILLGVRTYAVRDDLRTYNNRLLEYVRNGGVVIIEYNTPEYDHNYGPYPYVLGNNPEEVTDETSKVDILAPANPVFNWPNKITESDFRGWAEERGSKWMQSWDSHYEALLSTHDPDQAPQKGGLLYAKYGKGIYIYNAYAFYRQLPEGVPGAYRIFANMVSLPKNPAR